MRIITFKADEDMVEELDSLARLKGVTRSEIIRKAVELYLRLETAKSISTEPKRVVLYS